MLSGKGPLRSSPVSLYAVRPGKHGHPLVLARSRTHSDGTFAMVYRAPLKTILYLLVGKGAAFGWPPCWASRPARARW